MLIRPAATPANYFELIAAVAGSAIRMVASGSDTNININLEPKGTIGIINATKPVRKPSYTVATLPTVANFSEAFVTDANKQYL